MYYCCSKYLGNNNNWILMDGRVAQSAEHRANMYYMYACVSKREGCEFESHRDHYLFFLFFFSLIFHFYFFYCTDYV